MTLLRKLIAYSLIGTVKTLVLPIIVFVAVVYWAATGIAVATDLFSDKLLDWSHSPAKRCAR